MISLFSSSAASAAESAKRRAFENMDPAGLTGIFAGAAYVLYGLVFAPQWKVHPPLSTPMGLLVVLLALVAMPYCGEKLLERLKARIVYRRTGYVAVAGPADLPAQPSFYRTLILVLVFVAVAAGLFLFLFDSNKWIFLFAGGQAIANSYRSAPRNPRNWIKLLAILGVAVFAVLLNITFAERFGLFLSGLGTLKIIDGAIALVLYLRRNPVARMSEE
jgi:hypothetical protein